MISINKVNGIVTQHGIADDKIQGKETVSYKC